MCAVLQNALVLEDRARVKILPEDAPVSAPPLTVWHEGHAPLPSRPARAEHTSEDIDMQRANAHLSTAVDTGREEFTTDRFSRRADAILESLIRRMERPKT